MIHDPSKWAYRALSILVALLMIWIVLWGIPNQAGAAPLARCAPGSLMVTQTRPVHYLRCAKNGLWYAVSERTYRKLLAAALLARR